jgi:hypothetical protein
MKFTTAAIASAAAAVVAASPCKPAYATHAPAAPTTTAVPATPAAPSSAPAASPSASSSAIKDGEVFRIFSEGEGDLKDASIQAFQRNLRVGAAQGATCTSSDGSSYSVNYASLQLNDGVLSLYTGENNPKQSFYVDNSGMGQGVMQYTSGPANGRYFQTKGFAINADGNLIWKPDNKEYGFQACPLSDGSYSIWLDSVPNPAGQSGCQNITARAQKEPENNLISCKYTE